MLIYQRLTDTPYFLVPSNCHFFVVFPKYWLESNPRIHRWHLLSVFICPENVRGLINKISQYCQYLSVNHQCCFIYHQSSSIIIYQYLYSHCSGVPHNIVIITDIIVDSLLFPQNIATLYMSLGSCIPF